jgi:hypothetical protein
MRCGVSHSTSLAVPFPGGQRRQRVNEVDHLFDRVDGGVSATRLLRVGEHDLALAHEDERASRNRRMVNVRVRESG